MKKKQSNLIYPAQGPADRDCPDQPGSWASKGREEDSGSSPTAAGPGTARPDEADLVWRLKEGQEWAFNRLVTIYQERLFKIAYGITLDREESLEIVQDVFMSVHKNIKGFRGESGLVAWLRRITVNHCLNWKRKWKRRFRWHHKSIDSEADSALLDETSKGGNPETLVREKQLEDRLMTAVKKLPEKKRLVFVLSTFEGLSYQEIGEMLGINKGTVSSRLHAARTELMEVIKE